MSDITSFKDDALIAFDNITDKAGNLFSPTLRFGVTGLSRAGKTVFITSLVHNLLHGGRLPMFEAYHSGRISKAQLRPQPNMALPRFRYEDHIETLLDEHNWPQSTSSISQLRLSIEYQSASFFNRTLGSGKLNIDIVDYPGEWLLDLPLLGMSYTQWSKQAISLSNLASRKPIAAKWHELLKSADPAKPASEVDAQKLAEAFTLYLRACRDDKTALSTLPPGRFLMPGDLEGSPALTFCPLDTGDTSDNEATADSLHAMMRDRYEAYKTIVVKPFFREHFARLDRQIVLIDALQAINAGPEAVADLETALANILSCFRPGSGSWLSSILSRRIDRILFAATKADHLHHENHDRLQALVRKIVGDAIERARFEGARVDVAVLAAIRATREAELEENGETLPVIVGTPMAGETIDGTRFDGARETAIFPGDLPDNPTRLFEDGSPVDLQFVRFQPPHLEETGDGLKFSLPHIRLDRAAEFLFGDWLA